MALISAHSVALQALVATLLDFERAPGRYAVALREPRPLFDATHAVMLLAAGRPVEGLPPLEPGQHTGAVQQAARFFVRTVLLRPGADHYSLLGLAPDFEPETLRDHYRLMIRLTHPDFAASGETWPADAAARINIAHDVLGSVVKRAEYDASQTAAASASPLANPLVKPLHHPLHNPLATAPEQAAASPAPRRTAATHASDSGERRARRARKIALAAGGAFTCAALLWLMTPGGNEGSLVAQRNHSAASAQAPAEPAKPAKPASDGSAIAEAKAWLAEHAEDTTTQTAAAPSVSPPAPTTPPAPKLARAALAAPKAASQPARAEPLEAASAPARPVQIAATEMAPAKAPVTATAAHKASPAAATATATATAITLADFNTAPPSGVVGNETATRLTLSLDTDLAPAPKAAPPAAAPAPSTATALAASTSTAESSLTMTQVQPQLAQVLSGLKSGKGENVVRWLDGNWREHPAARAFVNNYQRALAGQSVVQLGKVQLRSRSEAEAFVVDGVVELYLQDGNAEPHIKELQISTHFLPKDGGGQPMLTQVILKRP